MQSNQTMSNSLEKFFKKVSNMQLNVSTISKDHKNIANNWYNWIFKLKVIEMDRLSSPSKVDNKYNSSSVLESYFDKLSKIDRILK